MGNAIYGRYIGKTSGDDEIVVYQCTKDELQLGQWYTGSCNKNDNFDGKYTVQRSSVKAVQAGPGKEDLFNCVRCEELKFTQDVLFVDNAPICFPCCQELAIDQKDSDVEFRPPKKISNEEAVENNVH